MPWLRRMKLGIGVPVDHTKSLELYNNAAKRGNPDAQLVVGKYLFSPLNRFEESKKITACAVEQGHREAAFELALHYEVDENFDMAYEIYRKGAMLGSASCINKLSYAYGHQAKYPTFGLNQDNERAKCLFLLTRELRENPELTFPDLDDRCPANVEQPPNRD